MTLANLRTARHWRQEDVADALEIARPTYTSWELGRREPNLLMVRRLARFFEVSVEEIVDRLLGSAQTPPDDAPVTIEASVTPDVSSEPSPVDPEAVQHQATMALVRYHLDQAHAAITDNQVLGIDQHLYQAIAANHASVYWLQLTGAGTTAPKR